MPSEPPRRGEGPEPLPGSEITVIPPVLFPPREPIERSTEPAITGTAVGHATLLSHPALVAQRARWGRGPPDPAEARFVLTDDASEAVASVRDARAPALVARRGSWHPVCEELRREVHLVPERLERFIGVIYRPETERMSHYYHASLASQFDALLHFDETRAVEPLERTGHSEESELAETYPTGL